MSSNNINGTQKTYLKLISGYFAKHGYAPSIQDVAKMAGVSSKATAYFHMNKLFAEGYLETDEPGSSPRAFRIGKRAYEEGIV